MKQLYMLALLGGVACGSSTDPLENGDFAPELNIDLNQMIRYESGTYVQDLTVGTGTAGEPLMEAEVYLTGWLADGTQFESIIAPDPPFVFRLGVEGIRGFREGVVGMRVGGVRRLVLPAHVAFGSDGTPDGTVPPNATLVFEVEMLVLR